MTSAPTAERIVVRPVDLALGVGLAVMTVGGAADSHGAALDPLGHALLVVGGLAVVVHRRWPLAAFAVALGAQVSYLLLGYPEALEWLPTMVALGNIAFGLGLGWAVPLAVLCLALALSDVAGRGMSALDAEIVLVVGGSTGAVVIGSWLRSRRDYLRGVEERAALVERHRVDEARRLVSEERLRIAREVHDVVAHAIASINVQAGVAEHVAAHAPERAREALETIRRTSSTALDDLRSVLGTLRLDDDDMAPPVGLDDLDRLVGAGRGAGLDVRVTIEGERRPLPAAIDRAAHRLVQEAVTNTIKHAGATRLAIGVRYSASTLELTVVDDGVGPRPAAPPRDGLVAGHGLLGMRERVAVLGGRLDVGAGDGGGFRVGARLPLRGAPR